jgi:ribosomal protein S18 acetylase RimI-like enzyme
MSLLTGTSFSAWPEGYALLALTTGAANARALGFYRHLGFRDEDLKLTTLL